jgi:hypothetical protein
VVGNSRKIGVHPASSTNLPKHGSCSLSSALSALLLLLSNGFVKSQPLTQQHQQKNLPHSPIWQANLLCIGLLPRRANMAVVTSTISL